MSNIIWEDKIDDRYKCTVDRLDQYSGTLEIYEENGDNVIFKKQVLLSYGAIFGPDTADVAEWQSICEEFIDGYSP